MAKKSRFKSKKASKDVLNRRSTQGAMDFDSTIKSQYSKFKVTEGSYRIRLLPIPESSPLDYYGMNIFVHYGVGPDNSAYLCLREMKGEPCPICEERERALADGDEDYAYELRANKRVLFWLIDRVAEKKAPTGPLLWDMPWTVDRDISERCIDKMTQEVLDITDIEEGYDVSFSREGKGLKTKYIGIDIARRESPLSEDDDEIEDWLSYIEENPLHETLNYYDYDHIAKVFGGKRVSKDEDEEEETSVRSRVRSTKRDEEEEDEEEESPRRRVRSRRDEEDEEESPRRRRRSAREEEEDDDASSESDSEGDDEEEEEDGRRSALRNRLRSRSK